MEDETKTLSVPIRLRRAGREITMRIDGTDPFATAKPDARLVKLLIRARQFNATLLASDGVPFAALAKRQGVSPSYFTRLVRLSYLAPDITEAILGGRQPPDLTAKQAAGAFPSATWLARAAYRAWLYLSRGRAQSLVTSQSLTSSSRHCGTGIRPNRDISRSWVALTSPVRLCRLCRLAKAPHAAATAGFSIQEGE